MAKGGFNEGQQQLDFSESGTAATARRPPGASELGLLKYSEDLGPA